MRQINADALVVREMRWLRKWNYKTNEYDPYEVPDDWNVSIGQGYTSRKIHTRFGMGYAVCKDCYDKEIEEELGALHEANQR